MSAIPLLTPALLFTTPLLVAASGELVVERAGVINIGIEGMILAGALAAWSANAYLGPAGGVAAGVAAAMLLGLLFAAVVLRFRADQIVAGTGINLLALGLTGLIYKRISADIAARVIQPTSPWWVVILAPLLAAGIWFFIARTRAGLSLRAMGESAESAQSAGVSVAAGRLRAILFGSACAGLAGAYLSTMRVLQFTENMTDGLGFLALAIVIFGRWNGIGIVLASLFFGLVRAGVDYLGVSQYARAEHHHLLNMLPYALSLLALAGLAGRSAAPAGLGKPLVRG